MSISSVDCSEKKCTVHVMNMYFLNIPISKVCSEDELKTQLYI